MSRRKRSDPGPEIYHRTLYPTVPTDGWGRFMRATTGRRTARDLWQTREGARKALRAEARPWPVRHRCVLVEHASLSDAEEEITRDLLYDVVCLACTWLHSTSGDRRALNSARTHAPDRALSPDEEAGARDLSFPVWQAGDGRPCEIEPGEGRHHAHAVRDLGAGEDFADCTTCGWRAGPYRLRWDADIAAKNHNWANGGSAAMDANPFPTRGTPCPRPFPAPVRILGGQ